MNLKKNVLKMLVIALMFFTISNSIFAEEAYDSKTPVASSEIIIDNNQNMKSNYDLNNRNLQMRSGVANIVGVYVYDEGTNKVKVSIQNIGLDWVDSVSMNVKVYNPYGIQVNKNIKETSIKQLLPRNNNFYVKGWNRIVISNIVVKDAGETLYLSDIDYWK